MRLSITVAASALLAATLISAQSSSFTPAATGLPTATIFNGVIIGTTTTLPTATAVVKKFLGIPYAQPPKRFMKPVAASNWTSPKNTSSFGPACLQQFVGGPTVGAFTKNLFNAGVYGESEDCLYVNVWVPTSTPPKGGFPVMFWIYGGSLSFDAASSPFYDGTSFAANQDIILVSLNYRTNVFGFPTAPELNITDRNLGFYDQRLALDWVQQNIGAFGGNKGKVTIFGESAGGESVDALLTSKWLFPPFHAAIMQSGNLDLFALQEIRNAYNVSRSWDGLISRLNCPAGQSTFACAQNANSSLIIDIITNNSLTFVPAVDYVTRSPGSKFSRGIGHVAPVPVLLGNNGQEGRLFQIGMTNLSSYIDTQFGRTPEVAASLMKAYAVGTPGIYNEYDATSQLFTELVFQCLAAKEANESRAADIPTWRYLFNATFPNLQPLAALNLGAYHSAEIPIVFGTYPNTSVTAQEVELSKFVQTAWADFAKDPIRGPGWAAVGSISKELAIIGTNGSTSYDAIKPSSVDYRCGLFDPVYAALGI